MGLSRAFMWHYSESGTYLQENPSNSTQQLRLLLWVIFHDGVICLHSKHIVLRGKSKHKGGREAKSTFILYSIYLKVSKAADMHDKTDGSRNLQNGKDTVPENIMTRFPIFLAPSRGSGHTRRDSPMWERCFTASIAGTQSSPKVESNSGRLRQTTVLHLPGSQ